MDFAGQPLSPSTPTHKHEWPTRLVSQEELDALPETDRVIAEQFLKMGRWALKLEREANR